MNKPKTIRPKPTICWTCARSRPIPGIGCPWARKFRPVEGWEAEETTITSASGNSHIASYRVCACPLYVNEGNVQSDEFIFDEQLA